MGCKSGGGGTIAACTSCGALSGNNVELDAVGMIAALSCSIRIGGHKGRDGGGGGGGIGRTPTEDISPSSEETEEQ